MIIDLTNETGPGEDNFQAEEDELWKAVEESLKKVSNESDQVKAFIDPRNSTAHKLQILKEIGTPLDSNLEKITISGLCNSDDQVRSAVVDLHKGLEDATPEKIKTTLAKLALHDDPKVRAAVSEILKIEKLSLGNIDREAEKYQLGLFTDPRTCEQEKIRIARRLKNASLESLQFLAIYGLRSDSPKVKDAVKKVLGSYPEKISPTPLEKLNTLEKFIDPRTSEKGKCEILSHVYCLTNEELRIIYLHSLFHESRKINEAAVDFFSDTDYIRDDELRDMLMDLCLHEDPIVKRLANKIMGPDNFILGNASRPGELASLQVKNFIDPLTCLEQKIQIAARLKKANTSSMKDFAIHGLHSESKKLRDRVIKVLQTVDNTETRKTLSELAQSEISHVSEGAKAALGIK